MTPLASYSEACLKESCGRVSVYVVPPSWDDKYHANPIRSAKCSVCSVTKLFFFCINQASDTICKNLFLFYLHQGWTRNQNRQVGVAESWNHMVEKQVTPGEVVWCTAGCLEGVELHHMSAWQLSQQLTSTTSTWHEYYGLLRNHLNLMLKSTQSPICISSARQKIWILFAQVVRDRYLPLGFLPFPKYSGSRWNFVCGACKKQKTTTTKNIALKISMKYLFPETVPQLDWMSHRTDCQPFSERLFLQQKVVQMERVDREVCGLSRVIGTQFLESDGDFF